jgi:hypothetical protein
MLEPFEVLIAGGRIYARNAGKFEADDGREVEYCEALVFEYRGKKAVIETAGLPSLVDHLANNHELRAVFKL